MYTDDYHHYYQRIGSHLIQRLHVLADSRRVLARAGNTPFDLRAARFDAPEHIVAYLK